MTTQHLAAMGVTIIPVKGSVAHHIHRIKNWTELQQFKSYWQVEGKTFVTMFKGLLTTYGWKVNETQKFIIYYSLSFEARVSGRSPHRLYDWNIKALYTGTF
jgi:hypothetical protein